MLSENHWPSRPLFRAPSWIWGLKDTNSRIASSIFFYRHQYKEIKTIFTLVCQRAHVVWFFALCSWTNQTEDKSWQQLERNGDEKMYFLRNQRVEFEKLTLFRNLRGYQMSYEWYRFYRVSLIILVLKEKIEEIIHYSDTKMRRRVMNTLHSNCCNSVNFQSNKTIDHSIDDKLRQLFNQLKTIELVAFVQKLKN